MSYGINCISLGVSVKYDDCYQLLMRDYFLLEPSFPSSFMSHFPHLVDVL